MTWNEYTSHIRALINDFGMRGLLTGEIPVKFRHKKNTGNIFTEAPHLIFRDDASFEFSENLTLISKQVQIDSYKYQYRRTGGYFFRYEKEETDDVIWKPPEHLHVILSVPHFSAPFITLENVLRIIEVNFYQEVKRENIVGKSIELIV
ncbi:hypothetical protein FJZ31_18840 [Candidatus Poribacteria bacterium]|nr:hypothetical protein [Candidatus Poribacteria bacterium]